MTYVASRRSFQSSNSKIANVRQSETLLPRLLSCDGRTSDYRSQAVLQTNADRRRPLASAISSTVDGNVSFRAIAKLKSTTDMRRKAVLRGGEVITR